MAIVGLIDARGDRRGLDDVIEGRVGLFGCPQPLARLIARKLRDDRRHGGLYVTTTAMFGCPLRTLIPRVRDVYVRVDDMYAMTLGTLFHAAMADEGARMDGAWVSEKCTCREPLPLEKVGDDVADKLVRLYDGMWHEPECGEARCSFAGAIDGVHVEGLVDAMDENADGTWTLYDWKFRNANALKFHREAPSPEDQMQLSVNAELARQRGLEVVECVSATVTMRGVVMHRFEPWDIEAVLDARPNGGREGRPPTTRELLHVLDDAYARLKRGDDPVDVLRSLPCVGEEMWKGYGRNACTSYCAFAEECTLVKEGLV